MLRSIRLEDWLTHEYTKVNIGGILHLYLREETVAVGVLHAAEPGDYVVSNYREHVQVCAAYPCAP